MNIFFIMAIAILVAIAVFFIIGPDLEDWNWIGFDADIVMGILLGLFVVSLICGAITFAYHKYKMHSSADSIVAQYETKPATDDTAVQQEPQPVTVPCAVQHEQQPKYSFTATLPGIAVGALILIGVFNFSLAELLALAANYGGKAYLHDPAIFALLSAALLISVASCAPMILLGMGICLLLMGILLALLADIDRAFKKVLVVSVGIYGIVCIAVPFIPPFHGLLGLTGIMVTALSLPLMYCNWKMWPTLVIGIATTIGALFFC